jgi:hypothetical protein
MERPALAPLVPWQPAQALDSIAGVGGAACAIADSAANANATPHLLLLLIIGLLLHVRRPSRR